MIKGNFKIKKIESTKKTDEQELEEYVIKSGAVGSHMIFRSEKKEDELFVDEL